jgi:hypothetical protein
MLFLGRKPVRPPSPLLVFILVIILSFLPARLVETSLLLFLGSGAPPIFPTFFSLLDCLLHTSTMTLGPRDYFLTHRCFCSPILCLPVPVPVPFTFIPLDISSSFLLFHTPAFFMSFVYASPLAISFLDPRPLRGTPTPRLGAFLFRLIGNAGQLLHRRARRISYI